MMSARLRVWSRPPLIEVNSVEGLLVELDRLRPRSVIADLEPMLAAWGSDEQQLRAGVRDLADALARRVETVDELVVATNSRREIAPATSPVTITGVSRARKPWALARFRDRRRPIAVVGDQLMTDGLLARRLGAPFLWWRDAANRPPLWPRVQRSLDPLLRNLFEVPR